MTNSQPTGPTFSHRMFFSARFLKSLFYGIVFIGIGYPLTVFWGWPKLQEARASKFWPSVPGEIIESEVKRYSDKDGKTKYSPQIVYDYKIGDVALQGNQLEFGMGNHSSDLSYVQILVNEYPVGKRIEVYYDSLRPEKSVLKPGAGFYSAIPLGIGLVFLLIGTVNIVFPIRHTLWGLLIGIGRLVGIGNRNDKNEVLTAES